MALGKRGQTLDGFATAMLPLADAQRELTFPPPTALGFGGARHAATSQALGVPRVMV